MTMDVEKIVREYIGKSFHMSLATVSDNKPWVCEVHFVYDTDLNVYWRSKESRRHSQEIANNPNVAGNIVEQHALGQYPHAVYFEGKANVIDDERECDRIAQLFHERLGIGKDNIIQDAKNEDGHRIYKITVENWYAFGKFGGDSGHKHQLKWNGGKK